MVCPNCGRNNKDGTPYCTHCGAALTRVKAQRNVQKAVDAYEKKPAGPGQKNVVSIIIVVFLSVILLLTLVLLAPTLINMMGTQKESGQENDSTVTGDRLPQKEEDSFPSNPYYACYRAHDAYVLPHSSSTYLSRTDLKDLSAEELTVAWQEIYARHGYRFHDEDLQEYFDRRSWYSATGGTSDLGTYEIANSILLEVYIAQQTGDFSQPGNPYLRQFTGTDSFALPNSQSRYLEAADLKELNEEQLTIARNEIYARHGYVFSDPELQTYFCTKSWYVPIGTTVTESSLNEYESNNIKLIQIYERKLSGVEFNLDNPYLDYYTTSSTYLFPYSDSQQIYSYELTDFTIEQCVLARNEIYARQGYAFTDQEILDYFLLQDWYEPGGKIGDDSQITLSETEKKNIQLLREAEEILDSLPELDSLDHTPSVTVSTNMYAVRIPAYWQDYAKYSAGNTNIRFDEKLSAESSDGSDGYLATISVVVMGEENYPSGDYTRLGILSDAQGNQWEVLAVGPTDVRGHPCALELYSTMHQDLRSIYSTIIPAEGYVYTPY